MPAVRESAASRRPSVASGMSHAASMDGPFLLPTGTVTFLLTDVEGSTRLWQEHEPEMPAALAELDAALAALSTGTTVGRVVLIP